jgi:hypothetical protein
VEVMDFVGVVGVEGGTFREGDLEFVDWTGCGDLVLVSPGDLSFESFLAGVELVDWAVTYLAVSFVGCCLLSGVLGFAFLPV